MILPLFVFFILPPTNKTFWEDAHVRRLLCRKIRKELRTTGFLKLSVHTITIIQCWPKCMSVYMWNSSERESVLKPYLENDDNEFVVREQPWTLPVDVMLFQGEPPWLRLSATWLRLSKALSHVLACKVVLWLWWVQWPSSYWPSRTKEYSLNCSEGSLA